MDPNTQPPQTPPQEPWQPPVPPVNQPSPEQQTPVVETPAPQETPAQEFQPQPMAEPSQADQPQPAMPQPAPQTATSPAQNPGQVLGIISIVLDFIGLAVVGLILGIISRKKSKDAGQSTTLGTVGMVLGIVFTILGILFFALVAAATYAGMQEQAKESADSVSSNIERKNNSEPVFDETE